MSVSDSIFYKKCYENRFYLWSFNRECERAQKEDISELDRNVSFDKLCTQELIIIVTKNSSDDFYLHGEESVDSL